ncbi:hypothetical protein B0H19DRAFT_1066236 [Mycena capillaripes]|nr:hypothetical protein B0H19DRAFT_1066236 [Mycena capillaripes]
MSSRVTMYLCALFFLPLAYTQHVNDVCRNFNDGGPPPSLPRVAIVGIVIGIVSIGGNFFVRSQRTDRHHHNQALQNHHRAMGHHNFTVQQINMQNNLAMQQVIMQNNFAVQQGSMQNN